MSSSEGLLAGAGETNDRQEPPVIINCLKQRTASFLAAADSFEGVTAEVLPLDTEPQALVAATKFCAWKDRKDNKLPLTGMQAVADNMFEHREEFSVVAILGLETYGLEAFQEQVEVLDLQRRQGSQG